MAGPSRSLALSAPSRRLLLLRTLVASDNPTTTTDDLGLPAIVLVQRRPEEPVPRH